MSEQSGRRRRNWMVQALLTVIALGLLALAIRSNRVKILEVFSKAPDYSLLAMGFAIYMAALCITFTRWYMLARAVDFPFKLRDAFRLGFIGNVFNLVIPGAVGGDLIKIVFLIQEKPDARAKAVASVVLDRLIGLMGLFLLAGIMGLTAWSAGGYEIKAMIAFAWLAALGVATLLAIAATPMLYRPIERMFRKKAKVVAAIERLAAVAAVYRTKPEVVGIATLMSMCVHGLFVIIFYLVGLSLFKNVPSLANHFVIVPLNLFSTAVPLPLGALGLSETVSDALFNFVRHPSGAVAMMGFRIEMYAAGLVSLVIYLFNARQVRELSRAAEGLEPAPIEDAADPRGAEVSA